MFLTRNETETAVIYRFISLLLTLSKLFQKFVAQKTEEKEKQLISINQFEFGLQNKPATVPQVYGIRDIIEKCPEQRNISSTNFLNVNRVLDKVW